MTVRSSFVALESPWQEIKEWIKAEAQLGTHDGDCDYIALICGAYAEYLGKETS